MSERFYPLGYPVDLETGSADVLAAAHESWGGREQRFHARPLVFEIDVREGAPEALPPGRRTHFQATADRLELTCGESSAAFCPACHRGQLRLHRELLIDRRWFRHHFLGAVVLASLDAVYFTPLHAACVVRDGKSVLLCGDSGAGKSCLAYACVRNGWTLVADDAVHAAPGPEHIVAGTSRVIRLRERARELFPELAGMAATTAPNGKRAIEIAPETRGLAVAPFAAASRFVFLGRRPGRAELLPYDTECAVSYFLKYLWQHETSGHEKHLRQLLAGGAQRLEYSDVDDAVELLATLVKK